MAIDSTTVSEVMGATTISSNMDFHRTVKELTQMLQEDMDEIVLQMVIGIGIRADRSRLHPIMLKEGIIRAIKGDLGPSPNKVR